MLATRALPNPPPSPGGVRTGRRFVFPGVASPRTLEIRETETQATKAIWWWLTPVLYLVAVYVWAKKALCRLVGYTPRMNWLFYDGISASSRYVRDNATTGKALEFLYRRKQAATSWIGKWIDQVWLTYTEVQAINNRLAVVEDELRKAVNRLVGEVPVINILSLACGSAYAVLRIAKECKDAGIPVQCLLVDWDRTAIYAARNVAKELGIEDLVEVRVGDVVEGAESLILDHDAHVVEMVGLWDYLDRVTIRNLTREITHALEVVTGGTNATFIAGNVNPNPHSVFLRHVVGWVTRKGKKSMIYRDEGEFGKLFDIATNWRLEKPRLEPCGIHRVAALVADFEQP